MKLRVCRMPCLSSLGKNGVAPSAPNASTKMAARRLATGSCRDLIPKGNLRRIQVIHCQWKHMEAHGSTCYSSYMQVTSSDIKITWTRRCLAIRLAEGQLSSLRRVRSNITRDKDIKSSNRILASCNGKEKER